MWTDSEGRDWSTSITVTTVKRVKQLADVLLTDAADDDLVDRLYADVILLCDVLYAVCQPQAETRDVTDGAFGELLAGDTIERACDSLMQDLLLFFQSGRKVAAAKKILAAKKVEEAKIRLIESRLTDEKIAEIITTETARAEQSLDEHLARHGNDCGKLPEFSE